MPKLNADSRFWNVTAERMMKMKKGKKKLVLVPYRYNLIVSDYGADFDKMLKRLTISKFYNIVIGKQRRTMPVLNLKDSILFDGIKYQIKGIDDLKGEPVKCCKLNSTFLLEIESAHTITHICSDESLFILKESVLS